MSDSDFACPATCQYSGKPWPKHLSVPTCRIFQQYMTEQNPVTKSSYREIIRNRIGYQSMKRPEPCELTS